MKLVKERPTHLQPWRSRWRPEEEEDSDSDDDIQLSPGNSSQTQEEGVQEDPAQELELDAVAPAGGGEDQQLDTETGTRRSERARRAPERFGDPVPEQELQRQLSPRLRKRIKSLAARKVPREEWGIRETRQDNLVMILHKKK